MNIITVYFENEEAPEAFKRILDVYEYAAKKYNPSANLQIVKVKKPGTNKDWFLDNLYKLDRWVDLLLEAREETVITDCDMVFTGDISSAFNYDFDIAYTKRTEWDKKYSDAFYKPINGGVFFYRPTERSKKFIREWGNVCHQMYKDNSFYEEWQPRYAGCNQTALGYLIETYKEITKKELPCSIYNGCGIDLLDKNFIRNKPLVLHIKRPLWQVIADDKKYPIDSLPDIPDHDFYKIPQYKEVIKYWRELEHESASKNFLKRLDETIFNPFLAKDSSICINHDGSLIYNND